MMSLLVLLYPFIIQLYLFECLESIISEIYRYLEIIVVNDGSKDDDSVERRRSKCLQKLKCSKTLASRKNDASVN